VTPPLPTPNEEALRSAALAVSRAVGQDVFRELVRALAAILAADVAFIALPRETDSRRMKMLAFYADGRIVEDFEYEVAGTPCETVLGQQLRVYRSGLQELFPLDSEFRRMAAQSYAGCPLMDARGRPVGLMSVVLRRRMDQPELVESVLKIFAARAEAELEHRQAESAIREREAQYRATFDASVDGMVVMDAGDRIVDANPAFLAMFGHGREAMLAMAPKDLLPAQSVSTCSQVLAAAGDGRVFSGECKARRADGSLFDIELRGVPMHYLGRPHRLVIVRDITERKRAEAAVRESEAQYRAMFNASEDALILWDSQLRRVDVNPAYERIYGWSRDEVIGNAYEGRTVPPGYAERRLELVRRSLAGEKCRVEFESLRKNGERFLAEVDTIPFLHRGEPHVLTLVRDITERRKGEERLRQSEERYRLLFEMESDAIVLVDIETLQHLDVNRAAVELYGYSREELLALKSTDLSAEDHKTRTAMQTGSSFVRVPLRYHRKKDGKVFPVEITANFFDLRGRRTMLAAIRDITERKQAEEARARLEEQLRQAQKMEAIGHLSGGIAHDFNNILTGILGYLTLAAERQDEIGDAKLGRHLEQARKASLRARDLIQQMLTFSRGGKGVSRPVEVAGLIEESVSLLISSLPSTVELATDLQGALPAVLIDPVQVEQVLLNLCINARDAMKGAGAIRVGVHAASVAGAVCASCQKKFGGTFVTLSVRDSGGGIPPQVMERMFEPFFSTKDAGRGSGMGLAMVHGIVHEHGGHIAVDSSPSGTTFTVYLPPLLNGTAGRDAPARTGERAKAPRPRLSGHVMVVDDEKVVGNFMSELLRGWGLEVTVQRSAPEAEAWLERRGAGVDVDVVVTDQTMPRMTGLELARRIRSQHPQLPVILYTGYAENLDEALLAGAGVRALLRKPVEPDLLYLELRKALAATGASTGAAADHPARPT
jgi:PAS domain S-box-containing protein